jgi:hypothetical protein
MACIRVSEEKWSASEIRRRPLPVAFLTDTQARTYARFDGDPSDVVLAGFF